MTTIEQSTISAADHVKQAAAHTIDAAAHTFDAAAHTTDPAIHTNGGTHAKPAFNQPNGAGTHANSNAQIQAVMNLHDAADHMFANAQRLQARLMAHAETNMTHFSEMLSAVAKARTMPEVMSVQASYTREQGKRTVAQWREIGSVDGHVPA